MKTLVEADWLDFIIRCLEDLVEERGVAPTGAGLSSEVLRVSKANELSPPPGYARKKFSKVVSQLESDGRLVKLEVPGADMFVAPADKPALLAEAASGTRQVKPGVRRDIFAALTIVSDKRAYYDPSSDSVQIAPKDEAGPVGAIPFPLPSLEEHTARAREFAETQSADDRSALLTALATMVPADFGRALSTLRLREQWHEFRTQKLTEILRRWAQANGIAFQSNWLTSAADGSSPDERSSLQGFDLSDRQRRLLMSEIFAAMSEEDVSRISVPLDIVLRLIAGHRK